MGSVEQRREHIPSRSRTEISHHPLRRVARKVYLRARLRSHCFQDVAQRRILGRNRQLAALE